VAGELRQALLAARLRRQAGGREVGGREDGAAGLSARQALWLGTRGGARCLGRDAEIGALRPGMLADVALWRVDGIAHDPIADPVAALVFGPTAPLDLLLVGGTPVVDRGEPRTVDLPAATRDVRAARRKLFGEIAG
jgi:cytosine/adenosine deaminase-related metal-dependent hydrolase